MLKKFSFILFLIPNLSLAQDNVEGFLEKGLDIISIENSRREADAWAMCSATYSVLGELLYSDSPNTKEMMDNMARGASVSIVMSQMTALLDRENVDPDQFSAQWESAKFLSQDLPNSQQTFLLAQVEMSQTLDELSTLMKKMAATMEICTANAESQQMYIDLLRDLSSSGLLTTPEE